MGKYICIHGHFYQPPRENPWLEDVELQDLAYPYHDWNTKITEECYKQNAASRILGPDKKIIDIVNNYSKISFDFGPTLLSWLERKAFDVYESIIEADKQSRKLFCGHGAAIAQAYNHMIMPLANTRDKYTQVIWGMRDFEHRFGRKPEGMWLPETAVDLETLDILAELGIRFTILSPHQAKRIRRIGDRRWEDTAPDKIDITRPYICRLASGRSINLFFYQGPTTQEAANGRILQNGEVFARKLIEIFGQGKDGGLAHIATDGETYGHHHRHTDMALAYCLHYIETNKLADITVYGEYLEKYPAIYEVEINENTSWSCGHGLERWRDNCGCNYGWYPSGKQQWRGPLREAMDWLREKLAEVYEGRMLQYVSKPWDVRNDYIKVVNDRSAENVEDFLKNAAGRELSYEEKVTVMKLLEMERNAMLMYTSCGWYFDDICGVESVQIMRYGARAAQLAREADNKDFEQGFEEILEKADTNVKEFKTGKDAYQALVKANNVDLNRVGAHLAVSSIFEEYSEKKDIYCYSTEIESYERVEAGVQLLATGRAIVKSNIVLERHFVDFAVLHLDDHDLICAVNERLSDEAFMKMSKELQSAFRGGDTAEAMRIMNIYFKGNSYSLSHLFKDEQRRILYELLDSTWEEIEASFRHIYEHNYTIMEIMRGMRIPLPRALSGPAEFIINQDIVRIIRSDKIDIKQLKKLVEQAKKLSLKLDETTLRFEASRKINYLMGKLEDCPEDINLLKTIERSLSILLEVVSELDLQATQNVLFDISKERYPAIRKKADSGDEQAKKWCRHFGKLAQYLGVKVE